MSVSRQFFEGAVFFLLFPNYASVSGLLQPAAFRVASHAGVFRASRFSSIPTNVCGEG